jgi:hypothetical protein
MKKWVSDYKSSLISDWDHFQKDLDTYMMEYDKVNTSIRGMMRGRQIGSTLGLASLWTASPTWLISPAIGSHPQGDNQQKIVRCPTPHLPGPGIPPTGKGGRGRSSEGFGRGARRRGLGHRHVQEQETFRQEEERESGEFHHL